MTNRLPQLATSNAYPPPHSQSTPAAYPIILGKPHNASSNHEKIPDAAARPGALLELLGRSGGSASGFDGELTPAEACTVCKCAVSLVGPAGGIAGGEAGGDPAGEGSVKTERGVIAASDLFPLDIDQEVI